MASRNGQLQYQSGFGSFFATEALPGALPVGQNSPQKVPYGLYAEQINGTAFTAPRCENRRTWMYRIVPSVNHKPFRQIEQGLLRGTPFNEVVTPPTQFRWDPMPIPEEPTDFVEGLVTVGGNGDASLHTGVAIHFYVANRSMQDRYFYNADGEMLIVPQLGSLRFYTELGILEVSPGEICLIPRGIKFKVELLDGKARGYICENFGPLFRLPELGPIGANGLANPRDFLAPVAYYEEAEGEFQIIGKFDGKLWAADTRYSPLNVVAWHGNYTPYKYNLAYFQAVNTVTFDHSDPSIFTVLTAPSGQPGFANVDFVLFPPRWMVAEHTFRPPWFHRNFMSEFMGLIKGKYDAKEEGFVPGGASLHNCMTGHGPDQPTYEKAISAELKPEFLGNTLAFMFETFYQIRLTRFALETDLLQTDYYKVWEGLGPRFQKDWRPEVSAQA